MDGLPLSFGKKAPPKKQNVKQKVDETRREVPAAEVIADHPKTTTKEESTNTRKRPFEALDKDSVPAVHDGVADGVDDDDDDAGWEGEERVEGDGMPVSHEIVLKDHSKVRLLSSSLHLRSFSRSKLWMGNGGG